ncbi:MAG TPA: hypothetical protein VFT06_04520 [Flavisolibacter sp.]|nr:hypothetical protein [Flavisolibacter sp.]
MMTTAYRLVLLRISVRAIEGLKILNGCHRRTVKYFTTLVGAGV